MKLDKVAFYLLIICISLTIITGKIELSSYLKYANIIILLVLSTFYLIYSLKEIINTGFNKVSIDFFSGIVFVLTSAFLAIFQSVQTSEFLTCIKLLAIVNGIYSYYLIFRYREKSLSIKHFIISSLLIGVSIVVNV
jgi:hypothetical protein